MNLKREIFRALTGSITAGLIWNLIFRLNEQLKSKTSKRQKIRISVQILTLYVLYTVLLKKL